MTFAPDDEIVIVCAPITWMHTPGSTARNCVRCKKAIWLSVQGQKLEANHVNAFLLCVPCAEKKEAREMPATSNPEIAQEAADELARRFGGSPAFWSRQVEQTLKNYNKKLGH